MTKRLFAYTGLSIIVTCAVVFYFGIFGFAAALAGCCVLILVALLGRNKGVDGGAVLLVVASVLVSLLIFEWYSADFERISSKYDGREATITATSCEDRYYSVGSYRYPIMISAVDGKPFEAKAMLYADYDIGLDYADKITAKVKLGKCDNGKLRSERFAYYAHSPEFSLDCKIIKNEDKGTAYIPIMLRRSLSKAIRSLMPAEEGALCSAVAFGTKQTISDDVYRAFADTGLSYLVVVSGLHMSIIAGMLSFSLGFVRSRRGRIARGVVLISAVLIYMCVTRFTPSVVRSGVMIILTMSASLFLNRSEPFNNLGLSAVVLCLLNPFSVGDGGLLLSYASVFGILYFYPRLFSGMFGLINRRRTYYSSCIKRCNVKGTLIGFRSRLVLIKALETVVSMFLVSVSALIPVMPLTLLLFGTANPFIALYSMLLAPLVTVIIVFSVIASIVYYIPLLGGAAYCLAVPAKVSARLMIISVKGFREARSMTLNLDENGILIVSFLSAIAFIAWLVFRKKRLAGLVTVSVTAVFALSFYAFGFVCHSQSLKLNIIKTGGSAIVQISGSGAEAVLYADGGSYVGDREIKRLHHDFSSVNTLVIPSASLNSARYSLRIMDEFDVSDILLYHSNRTAEDLFETARDYEGFRELTGGESVTLKLSDTVTDNIISTGTKRWQYVDCGGKTLLIGYNKCDAELLPEKYRECDLLIYSGKLLNKKAIVCKKSLNLENEKLGDYISYDLKG